MPDDRHIDPDGLGAVLWDMDGTLIDSQPLWIQAQTDLVTSHGGRWTYIDGLTLVGVSMDDVAIALQCAGVELQRDDIIQRIIEQVTASLRREVPWLPGAYQLVSEVADAGIPQAIVTSAPTFLAELIAQLLPPGAIQVVVADEHVTNAKPDPEPYQTAANLLGIPVARCVAIEDSPSGLRSAMAAGCAVLGVPRDTTIDAPGSWRRLPTLEGVTPADVAFLVSQGARPTQTDG